MGLRCTKCGRRGHVMERCTVDLQAAAREACSAILRVARQYPQGIERRTLLDEAGIKHDRGFKILIALRKSGEVVKRQTVDRQTLFTAAEHEAEMLAHVEAAAKTAANKAPGRQWPEGNTWTPPAPRIPSVWHLAQMAANEDRRAA
jgi:hypothetical protein